MARSNMPVLERYRLHDPRVIRPGHRLTPFARSDEPMIIPPPITATTFFHAPQAVALTPCVGCPPSAARGPPLCLSTARFLSPA